MKSYDKPDLPPLNDGYGVNNYDKPDLPPLNDGYGMNKGRGLPEMQQSVDMSLPEVDPGMNIAKVTNHTPSLESSLKTSL